MANKALENFVSSRILSVGSTFFLSGFGGRAGIKINLKHRCFDGRWFQSSASVSSSGTTPKSRARFEFEVDGSITVGVEDALTGDNAHRNVATYVVRGTFFCKLRIKENRSGNYIVKIEDHDIPDLTISNPTGTNEHFTNAVDKACRKLFQRRKNDKAPVFSGVLANKAKERGLNRLRALPLSKQKDLT